MIDINQGIEAFSKLGNWFQKFCENEDLENPDFLDFNQCVSKAYKHNGWFTREHVLYSLEQWGALLNSTNLTQWVSPYNGVFKTPKKVGIIMAGNLPLVGFHDFLSVLISGNIADIKMSSDDDILLPKIIEKLLEFEPELQAQIRFSQRLTDIDAVIATGSNNTARYFESYFGKYPHIIRKNRTSVAVLTGDESDDELQMLADDMFIYFGLGCRNVTKLYLPKDFDVDRIFRNIAKYQSFGEHHKYSNNYDYYRALYLLNREKFLENGFAVMKEEERLTTPVSVLHYSFYDNKATLQETLKAEEDNIQCIVSRENLVEGQINFGDSQKPSLTDYADNINILDFLKNIQ